MKSLLLKYKFKKLACVALIFSFIISQSYAQYENVWVFGLGVGVDFNSGSPVPIQTSLNGFEGSASVCDKNGKLLFYTEGTYVYDAQHNLMPNGSDLTPIKHAGGSSTYSSIHGSLIVPMPGDDQKYYIFSMTSMENGTNRLRLYYSVVDKDLNNGLGDVVPHQKGIFVDSNLSEIVTAVVGDHCNIWVLSCSWSSPELRAYEVTKAGVNTKPVISSYVVPPSWPHLLSFGSFTTSPDRRKIAISSGYGGGIHLFDFEPKNGRLSNQRIFTNTFGSNSVCFSPDGSKLYSSTGPQVYQFDMDAGSLNDIINSQVFVTGGYSTFGRLKLGPDNKIYYMQDRYSLSVINFPNELGLACQPQLNAVTLPNYILLSLPNIVPILKRDTIMNSYKIAECVSQPFINIQAADTTGWGYIWNDSVTTKSRPVHQSGTYWVSYFQSPCTYITDTFEVSISQPVHHDFSQVICSSEYFEFNGQQLTQSGKYNDTLIAANGCDSFVSVDLMVLPIPEVELSVASHDLLCIGDSITVQANGAARYMWVIDDRVNKNFENRNEVQLFGQTTQLTLIGYADNECMDTLTISIDAVSCCELFIPNAFSPNNDGQNDTYGPESTTKFRTYTLSIFNRWGQKVFETHDLQQKWDGTYKGRPMDPGNYAYQISGECAGGKRIQRKGDFLLIR